MLYGGPLGTYLSGYYGPGSSKSGSPSFTSTGSGPATSNSFSRPRTGRFRAPSAYGVTNSGTTSTSRTSPTSSRSSFYTPQTRRKYSDESTESPAGNRSRYTTPVNANNSGSSTTSSSGYYSRPSSSSTAASTVTPSTTTATLINPPPSSYARAATLSPYDLMPRRSKSQTRSRLLREPLYYPPYLFPEVVLEPNLDYRRLYEAERADTQELRAQIERAQVELRELRAQIGEARRLPSQRNQQQSVLRQNSNDAEQRMLEELRATSEKLKAEHRALTRVITRLM